MEGKLKLKSFRATEKLDSVNQYVVIVQSTTEIIH